MKAFLRRLTVGAMAVLSFTAVGVGLQAAPAGSSQQMALAAQTTRSIAIVSDVRIRPTPDTSQRWLTVMPAGSHPQYICYVDGETTKWFKVTWNGVTGYYSSIGDDIPLALQDNIEGNYGIPRCGTGTDINQGSDSGATVNPAPTVFNRNATVTWGLQHAQDIQPWIWSGCTWFLSQALWYGGFHQTDAWNGTTSHSGHVQTLPGTVAATTAPELVKYLYNQGLVTVTPLDGSRFKSNAIPEAELGDFIGYDWDTPNGVPDSAANGFSGISHLALITSIAPGQYPEVSEWGTAWPSLNSSYVKRGWTWSEKYDPNPDWLQAKHPRVTAILLHVTVPS